MEQFDRKKHWEEIYESKALDEVSWFQPKPETSLAFIRELNIAKDAKIIDVGGGDSFLVDHLLEMGYSNISVLDISKKAIERAKKRLGIKAEKVNWIVADVASFKPTEKYDLWHDRAAFHFLTESNEIDHYVKTVQNNIQTSGYLVLGTFSIEGPEKCSGIKINQYSEDKLTKLFEKQFQKIKCINVDHKTPFDTMQNFIFCCYKKNKIKIG